MAKILYLSVHSVLERDEVSLFQELGHTVFSLHGAYQFGSGDGKRPALPMEVEAHLHDLALQCSRDNLLPELVDWADIIMFMHKTDWIENNWSKIKNKKVIWRSIGQSSQLDEQELSRWRGKGLKIVRYSPREDTIPSFQGSDALIRFYKDEEEYAGYIGANPQVINVSQAMFGNETVGSRGDHMNVDILKNVLAGMPWKIFGPDNDFAAEHNGGSLPFDDLKNMLRFNRVFFYTGTTPAAYTLSFIEAMMTGIPIVAIGPKLGNSVYPQQQTYEVHEIIQNEISGYWSDEVPKLREYIQLLLDDHERAKVIGSRGRARAIEFFGKGKIRQEWKVFLENL